VKRNPLMIWGAGQQQSPQFRFWGSRKPPAERAPLRAQIVSTDDGAGTATLRLYDPIDSWGGVWGVSASEFADALDALDDSVNQIELRLNSPGGEVFEAVTILNLLRQHPADVTAHVDGLAASAASFLAAGADELVMGKNSTLMIHDAWGVCVGPAADMRQMGDLLDKLSNNIGAIYQAKAGGTLADWRGAMLAESWYDAQEAVDAGLADRVDGADEDEEAVESAENRFDLSMFKHPGREDAPPPPVPAENTDGDLEVAAAARARALRLREKQVV
jgi:ATP-dependent protease ClpP protease subunit